MAALTAAYLSLPTSDLDKCGNWHARKLQADDGSDGDVRGLEGSEEFGSWLEDSESEGSEESESEGSGALRSPVASLRAWRSSVASDLLPE